jgi:hypothetical protein
MEFRLQAVIQETLDANKRQQSRPVPQLCIRVQNEVFEKKIYLLQCFILFYEILRFMLFFILD